MLVYFNEFRFDLLAYTNSGNYYYFVLHYSTVTRSRTLEIYTKVDTELCWAVHQMDKQHPPHYFIPTLASSAFITSSVVLH